MKTLAILLPAMRMGGAEKICLNFLKDISDKYKVTMILNKKEGELLRYLPDNVEIAEDKLLSFREVLSKDIKKLSLVNIIRDIVYYLNVKLGNDTEKNYRYLVSRTPKFPRSFDCAIGYVANVSTQVFCLADRIESKKKIAWIHGETKELQDTLLFESVYRKFDRIFAVSEVTAGHFKDRFKSCENKTEVYYNPIDADLIKKQSEERAELSFDNDFVNIVTVGRLSPEKGCDMIPDIIAEVKKVYENVRWYIIGDGPEREGIEKQIAEKGLCNSIFLLGNRTNPYPYMKQADIYVQPSYEEGYSTTVCEAGILGKAIVGTVTSGGIEEQVEDGVSCLLAEPSAHSLASGICKLIEDKELKKTLENNVRKIDFSHSFEVEKLIEYIEKN